MELENQLRNRTTLTIQSPEAEQIIEDFRQFKSFYTEQMRLELSEFEKTDLALLQSRLEIAQMKRDKDVLLKEFKKSVRR